MKSGMLPKLLIVGGLVVAGLFSSSLVRAAVTSTLERIADYQSFKLDIIGN